MALAAAALMTGLLAPTAAAGADGLPQGAQAWLEHNAVPVLSLDPAAPLDDLQPLKPVLAKARIVQLGEASHGDGADFRAKVRLIRFLHEELGFSVLAFESGLYECEIANRDIQPGRDPRVAMRESIFGVWATQEVLPLFEYLCAEAGTQHPLRLTGFDPQFSAQAATGLVADLVAFLGPELTRGVDAGPLERFVNLGFPNRLDEAAPYHAEAVRGQAQLRESFDANVGALVARYGERETALCSRVVDNLRVWVALLQIRVDEKRRGTKEGLDGAYTQTRDSRMGDNVRWLAEEYYPNERIIVWAHNFHVGHGFSGLAEDLPTHAGRAHPMGEYIKQHFADQVYTIGFCAYDGYAGWITKGGPYRIAEQGPGSLPAALHGLGLPLAFVNLQGDGCLSGPFTCGFLEHQPREAPWSHSYDGVFFVDRMTPATKVGEQPAVLPDLPSSARPLLNEDLEAGTAGEPFGWTRTQKEETGVTCAWDLDVGHSGAASLCIADAGPNSDRLTTWMQQTRDGEPGRYLLSAFIKTEGLAEDAAAAVCVQCRDAKGEKVGFATTQTQSARLTGTNDWTQVSVVVNAPEETTNFLAFALLKGAGKVWFDDIQLVKQ